MFKPSPGKGMPFAVLADPSPFRDAIEGHLGGVGVRGLGLPDLKPETLNPKP